MKFWIDECLSPALVGLAHGLGYEATCTRDREQLGARDSDLLAIAVAEEFVFVTNNDIDFVGLCANADLHAGLVILPQGLRHTQTIVFNDAIIYIEQKAAEDSEAPADWMLNRVVDVNGETRLCSDTLLPNH